MNHLRRIGVIRVHHSLKHARIHCQLLEHRSEHVWVDARRQVVGVHLGVIIFRTVAIIAVVIVLLLIILFLPILLFLKSLLTFDFCLCHDISPAFGLGFFCLGFRHGHL